MKKLVCLLLVLTMVLALAACGAQKEAPVEEPAVSQEKPAQSETPKNEAEEKETAAEEKEPVTLKFLHWQTEISEQLQDVIDAFQEEYPWITVEQEIVPTADWSSVTAARISGNDKMDICGVQPWNDAATQTPAFYENEFLMDLSGLECVANFSEATLNSDVRSNGVLTSLPLSAQTMVVFYNVDLFKEYNVEVPATWSEFLAACEVFKSNGIAPISLGAKDGWPISNMGVQIYSSVMEPVYGDAVDLIWNGDAIPSETGYDQYLRCYADLTENGYWYGDPLATAYADAPVIFGTGKCAMYEDGAWSSVQISDCEPDFEVGVFALNASEDASYNLVPQKYGMTIGIANRTEHPEECKLFVEYMFRKDVHEALTNACAYIPTEMGVEVSDPLTKAIKELIDTREVVPFSASYSANVASEGYKLPITPCLQGIISGEMTYDEAVNQLDSEFASIKASVGK